MAKTLEAALQEGEDVQIGDEILNSNPDEILSRARLIENEIKFLKNEATRLTHEQAALKEKIKENNEKIKLNKQLPYLVGNVVEVCAISRE
jgi:26S proteasome regulatory subunit T5